MKNNKLYKLSWIVLIIPYLFYAAIFMFLPDEIPAHANAAGIVDRWINKTNWEVLVVCSMALFIALIANNLTRFIMDASEEKIKSTTKNIILLSMSFLFVGINISLMIYMYIYLPNIYNY